MQSDRHIKRLARELNLPDEADLVTQREKYWSATFCWLYFDRCDVLTFDDPHAGLRAAEAAPELVSLTERFGRLGEPVAPLTVRAFSVVGSAFRACGNLEEADAFYGKAFTLTKTPGFPKTELANLLFRVAVLRGVQGKTDTALGLANASVKIYERADESVRMRHLGEALNVRGWIFSTKGNYARAMQDYSAVLTCTDPKTLPRVTLCAEHNLACDLVEHTIDPQSLSVIERHLSQARRLLTSRRRSLPKLRVLWLQGMIFMRFGSERRGERAYRDARNGFIEMEAPFEMALVSLAIGEYLLKTREYDKLRELALDTVERFDAMCTDRKAHNALLIWKESVVANTASAQVLSTTWKVLEEQSFKQARRH